jgi:hypothetical protein
MTRSLLTAGARRRGAMRLTLLIVIGLLGLLVVGCGGGDDEAGGKPTAASPVAELPCEVPADIESYRFTMRMKMDIPGLDEALEELEGSEGFEGFEGTIPAGGPEGEGDGFEEMGEAFASLLGVMLGGLTDMSVEGAFVAPDRAEARMTFGDLELTSITIGDREWTKVGDMDWEESTAEEGGMTFTSDLCEGFTLPEVTALDAREETKNGVDTLHYHLDESDITRLADYFGGDLEDMWDFEDAPEEVSLDVWLAKDGNWPVRMEAEVSGEDEEGNDVSLSIFMEVRDLNDPDIKIEPPITSD